MSKAYLELDGQKIEFQFNPEDITMSRQAAWGESGEGKRSEGSVPEYAGPEPLEMRLKMRLDASNEESGDVSETVERLFEACAPTRKSLARDLPLPAAVTLGWDRVYLHGYIKKVEATYTMFRSSGVPVRAECSIDFREFPPEKSRQNPTSGGRGAQGYVQVLAGDTLAAVSYREYGDPSLWRALAEANSIDDPLRLVPGTELLVPAAVEAVNHR